MKRTTIHDAALQTLAVLVYGDSGIGKTTSLKTLISSPTMEDKVILAVSERSTIPLRGASFHTVLQLNKWPDVQELFTAFAAPQNLEDTELVEGIVLDKEIQGICLDTARELKIKGPSCIQLKRDERGRPKLIDINPRMGGTTIITTLAGINFPELLIKLCNHERFEIPRPKEITITRYYEEIVLQSSSGMK